MSQPCSRGAEITDTIARLKKLKPALRPKLRVFFSVDMVGSTAFKQAPSGEAGWATDGKMKEKSWQLVMLGFYKQFDETLRGICKDFLKTPKVYHKYVPTNLEFWKSQGDELLYTYIVESPTHLSILVRIWVKTLEVYGSTLREKYPNLDIKSAAWLAGFPIKNSEVIFEGIGAADVVTNKLIDPIGQQYQLRNHWYDNPESRKGLSLDFIGPAIDTGFRVAAKATPRRFCLTVELALLLSKHLDLNHLKLLKVYYDGQHAFKGVIGGNLYPVFWINISMDDELIERECQLTNSTDVKAGDLKRYCLEFIKANKNFLSNPFILDCNDEEFCEPFDPDSGDSLEEYLALLDNIQSVLEREIGRTKRQSKDIVSRGGGSRQIPQTERAGFLEKMVQQRRGAARGTEPTSDQVDAPAKLRRRERPKDSAS